jgi:hypothetical protein
MEKAKGPRQIKRKISFLHQSRNNSYVDSKWNDRDKKDGSDFRLSLCKKQSSYALARYFSLKQFEKVGGKNLFILMRHEVGGNRDGVEITVKTKLLQVVLSPFPRV